MSQQSNTTSTGMSATKAFKNYTDADKACIRGIRDEMMLVTGGDVKLNDAIAAVEPGMETPAHLRGL